MKKAVRQDSTIGPDAARIIEKKTISGQHICDRHRRSLPAVEKRSIPGENYEYRRDCNSNSNKEDPPSNVGHEHHADARPESHATGHRAEEPVLKTFQPRSDR